MILAVGLPAPWPALVSIRIKTGLFARLRRLQRGGELEAVRGDDAVVVVGGGDQGRRIARPRLDVVQGRIGVDRAGTARDRRTSRSRRPRPSRS